MSASLDGFTPIDGKLITGNELLISGGIIETIKFPANYAVSRVTSESHGKIEEVRAA